MAKRDRFREYARDAGIRRIEGLKKSLETRKWNEQSRQNIESRIHQLENAVYESRTYADGKRIAGHTKESTYAAAKLVKALVEETGTQLQLRKMETFEKPSYAQRNVVFTHLMNIASANQNVNVTIGKKSFQMTDTMVRMFYRAYQSLWNTGSVSVKDRNAVILQKTGFKSLEEAFAVAMGLNNNFERALVIEKSQNNAQLTDKEAQMLYEMLSEGQKTRYKVGKEPGAIALNTSQIDAMHNDTGEIKFSMTQEEINAALKNFLGQNFERSDID